MFPLRRASCIATGVFSGTNRAANEGSVAFPAAPALNTYPSPDILRPSIRERCRCCPGISMMYCNAPLRREDVAFAEPLTELGTVGIAAPCSTSSLTQTRMTRSPSSDLHFQARPKPAKISRPSSCRLSDVSLSYFATAQSMRPSIRSSISLGPWQTSTRPPEKQVRMCCLMIHWRVIWKRIPGRSAHASDGGVSCPTGCRKPLAAVFQHAPDPELQVAVGTRPLMAVAMGNDGEKIVTFCCRSFGMKNGARAHGTGIAHQFRRPGLAREF